MVILTIWFIIFVLSIKPLVSEARRSYRARTKDNTHIITVIMIPTLAHIGFISLLYIDYEGWIYWLYPLVNVMFVVHMILISDLVLDNYEAVKARVVNDKISSYLIPFAGTLLLLYFSVYVNDALFNGLCVSIVSWGVVGQLITYKNIRRATL